MVTIQPREILDEIWDEDLTSGRNSSPERVLRTVLARTSSGKLEEMRRNHTPFPPFPWKLVEGIRYLDTPAALIEEGEKMGHCVGTYVNACRTGKCYILALPNSTAEISPDGRVYQHKGMGNSSPPQKDHNLLMFWLQRRLTC